MVHSNGLHGSWLVDGHSQTWLKVLSGKWPKKSYSFGWSPSVSASHWGYPHAWQTLWQSLYQSGCRGAYVPWLLAHPVPQWLAHQISVCFTVPSSLGLRITVLSTLWLPGQPSKITADSHKIHSMPRNDLEFFKPDISAVSLPKDGRYETRFGCVLTRYATREYYDRLGWQWRQRICVRFARVATTHQPFQIRGSCCTSKANRCQYFATSRATKANLTSCR